MELVNEFHVPVPVEQAWDVLTDVERIAPCMPGATLTGVDGDDFSGTVKVKVGPITAQYKGNARFLERDPEAGRAVIKADGRESRGQGNANATVVVQLQPEDTGTKVLVTTDLAISGKAAQFGRGALAEVSNKLLTQFVRCLEADLLSEGDPASQPEPAAAGPAPEPAVMAADTTGGDTSAAPVAPTAGPGAATATIPADADAPATVPATVPAGAGAPAAPATARPAAAPAAPAQDEAVNLLGVAALPIAKRVAPVLALLLAGWFLLRARARR